MKSTPLPLALLIAATSLLPAFVRADDKPLTLTRTFKKGDVSRYKAESDISVSAGEAKLVGTSKTTVKEVKADGVVVVEEASEGGKLTLNGMDIDIPVPPPTTTTRDKSGKLLDLKKEETAGGQEDPLVTRLMASIGTPILQDKPVKAGDTWETEVDNPLAKEKKVKVKTTFVSVEKVDDKDLWKVKQTAEAATDAVGGKLTFEATFWLDPENGQEAKSDITVKDLPSPYGLLTVKTKAARVKSTDKADK